MMEFASEQVQDNVVYSRKHKFGEDDLSRMARTRLRKFQELCVEDGLDALLFIPGEDGRFNWGSQVFLKYVLIGSTGRELEGESYIPGKHEALEDCVFLVTPKNVHVYYNYSAAPYLLPILAELDGIVEYTPVGDELLDVDLSEKRKVEDFVRMLTCNLTRKSKVGIPFPLGFDDAMELETWPLIQAYAIDDFGGRGFFTMNFDAKDITERLKGVLSEVDANVIYRCVHDGMGSLNHHMKNVHAVISADHNSAISRLQLTERDVAEPLVTLHEFGFIRQSTAFDKEFKPLCGRGAKAYFGERTNLHARHVTVNSGEDEREENSPELESSPLVTIAGTNGCDNALHMTVEGEEPMTGVRVCRTYFLSIGKTPPGAPQDDLLMTEVDQTVDENDVQIHQKVTHLFQVYEKLVHCLSNISTLPCRANCTIAQLRKDVLSKFERLLQHEKVDIFMDFTDSYGRSTNFSDDHVMGSSLYTVFIRAIAQDIKYTESKTTANLGAVAVGDTFLFVSEEARMCSYLQSCVECPLKNEAFTLLTGEPCTPYFKVWTGCGTEDFNTSRLLRALSDSYALKGQLELGSVLGGSILDSVLLLPDNHFPWLKGSLRLYATGLTLTQTSIPPLVVSFAKHIKGIRVCETRDGASLLLMDLCDGTLNPFLGVLPFTTSNQVQSCAILLSRGSRIVQEILDRIPSWRIAVQQSKYCTKEEPSLSPELYNSYERAVAFLETPKERNEEILRRSVFMEAGISMKVKYDRAYKFSSNPNHVAIEKLPLTILVGVPGSGVNEVAAKAVEFTRDEYDWTHVRCNIHYPESTETFGKWGCVASSLKQAEQRIFKERTRDSRVLLSVCGYFNMSSLCTFLVQEFGSKFNIVSTSACISATQLYRVADAPGEGFRWIPTLWDQASAGWTSNVIFVDTDNTKVDKHGMSEFRERYNLRNKHGDTLQAFRTYLNPQVLDAITAPDNFDSKNQEELRCRMMGPYWKYLDYRTLYTGISGDMIMEEIQVPMKLNRQRLIKCFSEIFPKAAGLTSVAVKNKESADKENTSSNETGIRRVAQLAKMKVDDEKYEREGSDAMFQAFRQINFHARVPPKVIYGCVQFESNENTVYYIEASPALVSIVEADANEKPGKLVIVGRSADDGSIAKIFELSAPYKRTPKPNMTRSEILPEEVKKIAAIYSETPLPSGWWYDGSAYVDWAGNRLYQRPDIEDLIRTHLDKKNKDIQEYNVAEGLV